jgi:site-specific DNA-cytosine methylase
VVPGDKPSGTVIGATRPGSGAPSVADPRVTGGWYRGTYGVQGWEEPSSTVTGSAAVSTGRFAIADPRLVFAPEANFVLMSLDAAVASLEGHPFEDGGAPIAPGIREVRADELAAAGANPKKRPPFTPVIVAADGTWHRPMTTLELAALQGMPLEVDGEPLSLDGGAVGRWRERIGNAVPCPAAQAIAEQMLVALTQARLEAFVLSGGDVWVEPPRVELAL